MTHQQTVPETLEVEVFRTGSYGAKGTYTVEDLESLAADYSPEQHEAPVTLDHQSTGPAEGWVASLRRTGDKLLATLTKLSPKLRTLISSGAYKKRSVELYRDFNQTGKPHLKAISFLGAATPEVKGLADPIFSGEQSLTISFDDAPAGTESIDATEFRETLIEKRVWNPAWETLGFSDVITALPNDETRQKFLSILQTNASPVSFSSFDSSSQEMGTESFAFNGTPSDESLANHQKALRFMADHPTSSYVDALLRVTSETSS